jgi:hypothetical protein
MTTVAERFKATWTRAKMSRGSKLRTHCSAVRLSGVAQGKNEGKACTNLRLLLSVDASAAGDRV